jgi:hypothetical protein
MGLIQIGKGQPSVPGSGAFMLPPPSDCCQECAKKHDPDQAHNQQSIFYQYNFSNKHGRWPTWKDAVAHCPPEIQEAWKAELLKVGAWSEPKEDLNPEEKTAHILMGSALPSKEKTMEPGNIMKMETIKMGDGLRRARGAAMQTQLPIKVRVGQVWEDNDPRGTRRKITVIAIKGDQAVVQSSAGRKTKITLSRFRPTNTGYKLVTDAS